MMLTPTMKKNEVVDEEEEPVANLDSQFLEFAKMLDRQRPRDTITLYCSDYWMRQSKIIDDRKVTMTDTGVTWWKFSKTELSQKEWKDYLKDLCALKALDQELVEEMMTNCGLPGQSPVHVPRYRDFFLTSVALKRG
ncbi:hypothetical protein MSG28_000804 [Choristoneura fumiferana]|uniref:Uncharacterized protein n=1 Tax=Choristoneura fumiferana TaxID=7141 RepID=A0ACC0K2A6_CHOFU|nr:hypothetical protein MSG28_000804 [Choristoneura fumiferana]